MSDQSPKQAAFDKEKADAWKAHQADNAAAVQKPHDDFAKEQAKNREDYSPKHKADEWQAHQDADKAAFQKPTEGWKKEQAANAKEFSPQNKQAQWDAHKASDAAEFQKPQKEFQAERAARQKEFSPEQKAKNWQGVLDDRAQSLADSQKPDGQEQASQPSGGTSRQAVTVITHVGGQGHATKLNEPGLIAPIKSGTFDTLLGIERGNQVIKVANQINSLMGDGHLQAFHADAGIRISFLTDTLPGEDTPLMPDTPIGK